MFRKILPPVVLIVLLAVKVVMPLRAPAEVVLKPVEVMVNGVEALPIFTAVAPLALMLVVPVIVSPPVPWISPLPAVKPTLVTKPDALMVVAPAIEPVFVIPPLFRLSAPVMLAPPLVMVSPVMFWRAPPLVNLVVPAVLSPPLNMSRLATPVPLLVSLKVVAEASLRSIV